MRKIILILCLYFIMLNAGLANTLDTKSVDHHDGFVSIINSHKKLLPESSQCIGFLNQDDKTIGDLLASFLAWPSKKPDRKYLAHSQCHQSKHKISKDIIDILDCSLTITEAVASPNAKPTHIISTMRFFVDKNDKYLIKNSLTCY